MSEYYNARRTRNLFDPASTKPFRLSRSKLDLFLKCARCFYLDRRLGVGQPPGFPFNLNSAVDALLKKEFDAHRRARTRHALLEEHELALIPFDHPELDAWRDSLRRGITYAVPGTPLVITGGVDDVWVDPVTEELTIADYKATAKEAEVSLDADWQIQYKRQAEIYQWLFRKNGFRVSDVAYFVYCNGRTDLPRFDRRLEFRVSLLPHRGNAEWVDGAVARAHATLVADGIPARGEDCDHCQYVAAVNDVSR
jgi:hypothetical protein